MARVSITRAWLAAVAIACASGAALGEPAVTPLAPLAHSTLLAVDAAPTAGGLALRVRRATQQGPLVVNDLSVTIDGQSRAATARDDGSWFVPRPPGVQDAGKTIEVTVGHDGIHELLSGRLAASPGAGVPGSSGITGLLSSRHKQLAWWILNIAIVLVAAIAISRRAS